MIKILSNPKNYENTDSIPSGIHMKFENGNTISIQFSKGNYCDNRDESKPSCNNCEIAIWNEEHKWYSFDEYDVVKGYCTTDELADWIQFASKNTF